MLRIVVTDAEMLAFVVAVSEIVELVCEVEILRRLAEDELSYELDVLAVMDAGKDVELLRLLSDTCEETVLFPYITAEEDVTYDIVKLVALPFVKKVDMLGISLLLCDDELLARLAEVELCELPDDRELLKDLSVLLSVDCKLRDELDGDDVTTFVEEVLKLETDMSALVVVSAVLLLEGASIRNADMAGSGEGRSPLT